MAHEELSVAHDDLVQDHAFLTKDLSNEKLKLVRAHHMDQLINHIMLLTLVMYARRMYPPLIMIY